MADMTAAEKVKAQQEAYAAAWRRRGGGGSSSSSSGSDTGDVTIPDKTTTGKYVYTRGADNQLYFQQDYGDATDWATSLQSIILNEMVNAAKAQGIDENVAAQIFSAHLPDLLTSVDQELLQNQQNTPLGRLFAARAKDYSFGETNTGMGPQYWVGTTEGFGLMLDYARNWMQLQVPSLKDTWAINPSGGGGGGGSGALTSGEIRAQFDLDQLAAQAQTLYQGLTLDDLADPKAWAREYVDKIVATKAQQKIDYATFITKKIEGTARYASIYENKPPGMTPQQYLQPYYNAAAQVLGASKEAAGVAIGGAQLGASTQDFQQRLNRTDTVTGSAPFIASLENRLTSLRKVFKVSA